MLTGGHVIIYSKHPEADRAFLRDVIGLTHADAGEGWLIFGLPPSEVAVHPAEENDRHEFYPMCDDVGAFIAAMREHGVPTDPVEQASWGKLTHILLPGGGRLGVYEPRHARPKPMAVGRKPRKRAKATKRVRRPVSGAKRKRR